MKISPISHLPILLIFCMLVGSAGKVAASINQKRDVTTEVRAAQFYSSYCIYILDDDNHISSSEIEALILETLPAFKRVDSLSVSEETNEYVIIEMDDPVKEYPAPDLEYLEHFGHGLSDKEKSQVQTPFKAVYLLFAGVSDNVVSSQIGINQIIATLITGKNKIVLDDITYEVFNSVSWNEDRVIRFSKTNQDLSSQVTIHTYREEEYCRAVTLGMEKFSLPDISIQNISCHDQLSFVNLINLVGQTWLENPNLNESLILELDIESLKCESLRVQLLSSTFPNSSLRSTVTMALVEPQEGDAYNTQYELVFNDKNYSSIQEEQDVLLTEIFGFTDEISHINHNEELLEASEAAKRKLPALKAQFNNGLDPGYSLLLKAPFETDTGGSEWMWVEVTKWSRKSIEGILQNDPFEISQLKSGSAVKIDQDDVFDYILYYPDGTSEGNKTGEIISKM